MNASATLTNWTAVLAEVRHRLIPVLGRIDLDLLGDRHMSRFDIEYVEGEKPKISQILKASFHDPVVELRRQNPTFVSLDGDDFSLDTPGLFNLSLRIKEDHITFIQTAFGILVTGEWFAAEADVELTDGYCGLKVVTVRTLRCRRCETGEAFLKWMESVDEKWTSKTLAAFIQGLGEDIALRIKLKPELGSLLDEPGRWLWETGRRLVQEHESIPYDNPGAFFTAFGIGSLHLEWPTKLA